MRWRGRLDRNSNSSFGSHFSSSHHREKAGVKLEGGSYLIHKIYTDAETLKLVGTACEVLGELII